MRRCTCVDDERTCREHNINRTELERLRAEVRDLKARLRDREARLKAARKAAQADEPWMDSVPVIERVTDLRNKNWRKP